MSPGARRTRRTRRTLDAPSPGRDGAGALGPALGLAAKRLAQAGIESARLDARLLAAAALGWPPARVMARPEHRMSAAAGRRFEDMVRRRLEREPVALILGRREFWGRDFLVTAATLVPRPESETVVERALAHVDRRLPPGAGGRAAEISILDLGVGSGCLLLTLLCELPRATGLGVDVSAAALAVAKKNARRLGLAGRARVQAGDWSAGIAGAFDLIVANPPYIADAEMAALMPEVARFEPRLALAGGPDGLACHGALLRGLGRLLAAGGIALIEIGAGQGEAVRALAEARGLGVSAVHPDLAGRPRVVEARADF